MGRKMGQDFRGMGQSMGQNSSRNPARSKERQALKPCVKCTKPDSGNSGCCQNMGQESFIHMRSPDFVNCWH